MGSSLSVTSRRAKCKKLHTATQAPTDTDTDTGTCRAVDADTREAEQ